MRYQSTLIYRQISVRGAEGTLTDRKVNEYFNFYKVLGDVS